MKYLIYELFSGVGLCNQIFSRSRYILTSLTKPKTILLIKNPLVIVENQLDYGYLLNFSPLIF